MPFARTLPLAAVLLLVLPAALHAQFKFREPPGRRPPAALHPDDGQLIWERFQLGRAIGAFTLEGVLVYRPAREPSRELAFRMEGDWLPARERTRLLLERANGAASTAAVEVSGGAVFPLDAAADAGARAPLDAAALEQPLFGDLPFSWADLLMPYLHWPAPRYLGPDRYLGRPAHRFELLNPVPENFPARVVVTLDASYAALLRADLHAPDGRLARRIRVGGFRQFGDDWMFSELNWQNRSERESMRLAVYSFVTTP